MASLRFEVISNGDRYEQVADRFTVENCIKFYVKENWLSHMSIKEVESLVATFPLGAIVRRLP